MAFVPACVLANGVAPYISCKDMRKLRVLNKEFSDEMKAGFYEGDVIFKYFKFYMKNPDVALFKKELANSDLNVIELERMIDSMIKVKTRKWGERYGYLFKCNLFTGVNLKGVTNTLMNLRFLSAFALEARYEQVKAPTDLLVYTGCWVSDYCKMVFHAKNPNVPIPFSLVDYCRKNYYLVHKLFESLEDNMHVFFEYMVKGLRNPQKADWNCADTILYDNFKEFASCMNPMIELVAITDGVEKGYWCYQMFLMCERALMWGIVMPPVFSRMLYEKSLEVDEFVHKTMRQEWTLSKKLQECAYNVRIMLDL